MNDYKLPPLPNLVTHEAGCFDPTAFVVPLTEVGVRLHQYAEAALAPLLQDLAAHEASNRIRGENLETLREQNAKLREAARVFYNLTIGDSAVIIRPTSAKKRDAIIAAGETLRAALGESNG